MLVGGGRVVHRAGRLPSSLPRSQARSTQTCFPTPGLGGQGRRAQTAETCAEKLNWRTAHSRRDANRSLRHARKDLYGFKHVTSMITSIGAVLSMAKRQAYAHVLLIRHDLLPCAPVPLFAERQFVLLGRIDTYLDGVPDQAFSGDQVFLEHVFETLLERLRRRERLSRTNSTARHERIFYSGSSSTTLALRPVALPRPPRATPLFGARCSGRTFVCS